ncbi:MAG TPA: pyridoxamine 5'-phosphate oxidase family protein [Gaiellaceae bacterium]|nr:pyridoxamine 5'-phosphate oxidase family protein [Gaiellaceae bacterium]
MADPTPAAPRIPSGYGVPRDASGAGLLPWSWAVERLEAARNYWLCTTRSTGRPHAAPVWGVWLDGAVWFSTSPSSQKGRNLARQRWVVIHLESGDEAVILEGQVEEVDDRDARVRFADAYEAKYDYRPDPDDEGGAVYVLRPRLAQTWRESDYTRSATRWIF